MTYKARTVAVAGKNTQVQEPNGKRVTGVVKWFSRQKGYGFILPDDGSEEVFVHFSAIAGEGYRNLEENDRVSFYVVDVGKGAQAQGVQVLR